jgi:hypothetical protein
VSQKIEELKIYIKISQYTRSQNSHQCQLLTTETLTSVHTHTLEASQTLMAISDPATANFRAIKTWETQVSHRNQGTRTPTYILEH